MFTLILGLIVAVTAVVFSFQNTEIIQVNFLSYNFEGSLALILISTLLAGFIIGLFVLMPLVLNQSRKARKISKEFSELKENEENLGIQYNLEGSDNFDEKVLENKDN